MKNVERLRAEHHSSPPPLPRFPSFRPLVSCTGGSSDDKYNGSEGDEEGDDREEEEETNDPDDDEADDDNHDTDDNASEDDDDDNGDGGSHDSDGCGCSGYGGGSMVFDCLFVAKRPSNMLLYLRDGSAQTILHAATLK